MFTQKKISVTFIVLMIFFNSQATENIVKLLNWDFGNNPNNPFCNWQIHNYDTYQIVENHLEFQKSVYTLICTNGASKSCGNPGPLLEKTLTASEQEKTVNAKYLFVETKDVIRGTNSIMIKVRNLSGAEDTHIILCGNYNPDDRVEFQDNGTIKIDISDILSGGKKITYISFILNSRHDWLGLVCDCYIMIDVFYNMDKIYIARENSIMPILNYLLN